MPRNAKAITVSELDTLLHVPLPRKIALDEINGNYSLDETDHSGFHARRMR